MATLYVTEYSAFGVANAFGPEAFMPLAREPGADQTPVTFTTAAQSAAFAAATRFVRLYASADCHVLFGADPTATANHQKLAAGQEYWRAVVPGQKVSVYDGSST